MEFKEITKTLNELTQTLQELECAYIENEGECTAETEAQEATAERLRSLLQGSAVDSLTHWLKTKEQEVTLYKAERDALARKARNAERAVAFIKAQIFEVMVSTGVEEIKTTNGYTIKKNLKREFKADSEGLNNAYKETIQKIFDRAKIPPFIGFSLRFASSGIEQGEKLPDFVSVSYTPTISLRAPRVTKKNED